MLIDMFLFLLVGLLGSTAGLSVIVFSQTRDIWALVFGAVLWLCAMAVAL
jgi:hypothetical protein